MAINRRRLGTLLAVAWLAAIVIAYIIVHFPPPAEIGAAFRAPFAAWQRAPQIGAIALTLLDVLAVAVLVALGGAVGALILPHGETFHALERAALRVLVGLAALSVVMLALALAHLLPPRWMLWGLTVLGLAALNRPLRACWADLRAGLAEAFAPEPDALTRWVRRIVVLLLILAVPLALLPPTKWDALTYHLTAPALYLDAGGVFSFPENHFLGFPQLVEMLYLWLLILARDTAPALLHWVFGGILLLLLLGMARRAERPSAAWLATGVLLASESIWGEFWWPYNDLALMAYTLGAAAALLAWSERHDGRLLMLAGVLTGCMMGIKYTAASYTLGVALLVVWLAGREGVGAAARALATVAGVALLTFAPWLLKNWLTDGNPVSPFVWGTAAFDALDQWFYARPGTGFSPVDLLLVPLRGTVFGTEWLIPYGVATGPLWVTLPVLMAVGWKRRPQGDRSTFTALALSALPGAVVWLAGAATSMWLAQLRLLYPLFPAAALMGGLALAGLGEVARPADVRISRRLVGAAAAFSLLLPLVGFAAAAPFSTLSGARPREDYLLAELQAHYAAMQAADALLEGARVLTLWEPRVYYCRGVCVPDSLTNEWWRLRQASGDPFEAAENWRAEGYTHVLSFDAGLRYFANEEPNNPTTAADAEAFDQLRGTALVPVREDIPGYTLYEIVP